MSAGLAAKSAMSGGRATRLQDLIFPVGIVASVLVILVPLPAALMDLLLSANIAIAVIMLLTTIYVRTPLEFSIFPSLLLATTLFRLVLNVATTRLILTQAGRRRTAGGRRRGEDVRQFVTGGVDRRRQDCRRPDHFRHHRRHPVRRHHQGRHAHQRSGRPLRLGRHAGQADGHRRRPERRHRSTSARPSAAARKSRQQADFFGAMDGASKFVRGDAIAGIIITLINIVGGLFIGMVESGMSLGDAAQLFTTLTIGDGLVSQVPAFLISLAAGLLVTRSSNESDLPHEFIRQLFSRPQALAVAGGFLGDSHLHQPAADSAAG